MAIAKRNNPEYLAQQNDEHVAEWAVREAYGTFLPSATTSFGLQYQAEGTPRVGIFTGADFGLGRQSYYFSDYSLGFGYQLSGSSFFRVPQARADRNATLARTLAAAYALESAVTRQYIAVLGSRDAVLLATQELARAQQNLQLAQARVEVGEAIALEAKQAEVERGRAEVELIRVRNQHETDKLRLTEQLGVELDADLELSTEFRVFEPTWTAQELVATALAANPQLGAQRAVEHAGAAAVKMAVSSYLPSLDMSLGWAGFTREAGNAGLLVAQAEAQAASSFQNCGLWNSVTERLNTPMPGFPFDCSELLLSPTDMRQIRAQNDVFPFAFERQPLTFQLRLSLPVFTGFTRQRQIEEARAVATDASLRRRAEELRVRADVTAAFDALTTAYQTSRLEERNAELAAEQLELARQRYRIGMSTFFDLLDAETLKARADRALLAAIYTFHESLATLETAVGRPLRLEEDPR
ncbi:MAG: TolC family protein [Longimicrobiales bacterium]